MWKKILQLFIAICLLFGGNLLLQGDFIPFLQWWITVFLLGILCMPVTAILFSQFNDKGYLFSKTIGIALSGYLMWLFSSLRIMKFSETSCMVSVAVILILNALLLLGIGKKTDGKPKGSVIADYFKEFRGNMLSSMITEELMFFGLFLLFVYIRAFKPEAYGTEKFMDYGFMTTMMRSDYMPPQDLWFSGTNINYYYVGQYIATYLTRLSRVSVAEGYNLMLMMIGAFAVVLPYSLSYNLIRHYSISNGKNSRFLPGISGWLAGAGVSIAGNMHYPIYKWLVPYLRSFFGLEKGTAYWFPDATRYIGYNPETSDKTIHEFPSYSFILGDLHAHVINILFVLTVLGILFAWQMKRMKEKEVTKTLMEEVCNPALIMLGFFIGLFHTTNYWDFPIYYVVCGAVILFSNMIVYNFKGKALWLTAIQGIFIVVLSEIVCLPFTINFDEIPTGIEFAVSHTPFYQLAVLWGLPISMVTSFLCFLIAGYCRNKAKKINSVIKKKPSAICNFMAFLKDSDLFVLTIGLCAIGLILLPEIIYVKDIYSGDYKRANTMFKLTYQSYILFGICFGYLFVRLIRFGETIWQRVSTIFGLFFFTMTLFYAGNAVKAWYGDVFDRTGYKGIDAEAFMETTMPDDYLVINWLKDNVSGVPVVLEANGDSYSDYERVSVMTGLPTVLGWRTHEWLWKSDTTLLEERESDIQTIYTSYRDEEVKSLIQKYKIQYIYVGKLEQEKFENVNHDLIKNLGDIVFLSPVTEEKAYETYIVQIMN